MYCRHLEKRLSGWIIISESTGEGRCFYYENKLESEMEEENAKTKCILPNLQ